MNEIKGKKECRLCEGSGVYNAPNGDDDFTQEVCPCTEGDAI
ncbi:MAG: hypothetical protein Q6360_13205 [Candidatus Brocadiales bacterium]|nr:hypothetical protein [Candidatus Brocadiales bacterium]